MGKSKNKSTKKSAKSRAEMVKAWDAYRTKAEMYEKMYMRIRNVCGLLGVILPWLALFSAGIAEHPSNEWWWSISATYYQSPALVGVLVPASIVLISYIGYTAVDDWITGLSGVFGLGIVLFPCKVSWIEESTRVGFFQLPIETSNILHMICASAFFFLLAYNSIFLFTRTNKEGNMTERKKLRNKIYKGCGLGMIGLEVLFVILAITPAPGYCTMITEIFLLFLFGMSWLVKGDFFPCFRDEEE